MRINFIWIFILILPYILVTSQPVPGLEDHYVNQNVGTNVHQQVTNAQNIPKQGDSDNNEQIISVRITSSVAVGRTKARPTFKTLDKSKGFLDHDTHITTPIIEVSQPHASTSDIEDVTTIFTTTILEDESVTDIPPNLIGANIEYINQLKAKKGIRGLSSYERLHSFTSNEYSNYNETNDSVAESSMSDQDDVVDEVPLARSVPLSYYKNNIQENVPVRGNSRLTTVNFNVVHENQKVTKYNDRVSSYINPNQNIGDQKFYNEPSKVYSQPSQVYSEPAKFYSEPAKIYSVPAKIYSEPAKIYSEPAKIYSEPSKFYSQPASLHLSPETTQDHWPTQKETSSYSTTITTPIPSITGSYKQNVQQQNTDHQPEKNYEVDEKVSVLTDGRSHGEQSDIDSNPENCKQENCKVGYVVEGRQFRKYRVEERTPDGFIVGEYGVVRNEDGALRGVRYTADSEASPRLIHDALMKFLQLK